MNVELIVAVDENWGIGREGELLCRIPEDLERFRALTMGHTVLMGRKTLNTLPNGKPLPGRRNLVLTGSKDLPDGVSCLSAPEELDRMLGAQERVFVIGGESVYRQFLPRCDRAYVTKIKSSFTADRFFPDLDANPEWRLIWEETPPGRQNMNWQYCIYERMNAGRKPAERMGSL